MNTQQVGNRLRASLQSSALALTVALLTTPAARGQLTMALTGDGTTGLSEYAGEADGYKFTTGASPLIVGWLGFYDAPNGGSGTVGDDLLASHRVSIWRESDQLLMARTTVVPGDPLIGSFRGRNVALVKLEANTAYVIAADYAGGDRMREGNDLSGWGLNGISINADDGRWGGAGGGMPTAGWSLMIGSTFGYKLDLAVTLDTPAANQSYPTGSSVIASASVLDIGPFNDTVTFHVTPIDPPGAAVQIVSTGTASPYTADFGVLPAGSYEMYATVANDNLPSGTDTSATHSFTVAAAVPTTTTVSSSGTPSVYGSATLTATVAPTPAGGTVQFYDGGVALGSPVAVNSGTGEAPYNANTLGAGSHEITAEYSGFGVHGASSTTAALTQTVDKAPLTVKALNTLRAPDTANPDPFPYQITGYQNGENLSSSGVTGTPELTTTAVVSSPVGDYPVTCAPGTLAADNYSFSFVDATLTVAEVANTFSLNFFSYGGLTTEEQRENVRVPAGVPAGIPGSWFASGWSNFEVPWNPDSPLPPVTLTSNEGSTATFTFKDCRNGWTQSGGPRTTLLGDGNGNMMDGHVNSTLDGDFKFDMEVTGIPFAKYDVIFYMGANAAQYGDGTGRIVFNGAERGFTVKPGAFDGTFTEMVDAATAGNYIVFTGVTGSSFTTQTWGTGPNNFNHVGPFGFQIREVAVAAGYGAWASANAGDQTPDQDYDNDGVENGVEYFMGQTGSSVTTLPGLDGTNTVSWTMDPAYAGAYEVQTSPDLATWTNVAPKPVPADGNLSYTLPPGLGKQFVRLLVTPAP